MELTYKTCYKCSKIQEDQLIKYMNYTNNLLIYEFINKLTCDMIMQQWECFTCPPFTIEMYCKAAIKTYFKQDPPKKESHFNRIFKESPQKEKQELYDWLKKASIGKLKIQNDFDTSIIDNIII